MEVAQAWPDEYEGQKLSPGVIKGELVLISVIWNLLSKLEDQSLLGYIEIQVKF